MSQYPYDLFTAALAYANSLNAKSAVDLQNAARKHMREIEPSSGKDLVRAFDKKYGWACRGVESYDAIMDHFGIAREDDA